MGKEVQVTEELEEVFKVFDEDFDGFISPEELILKYHGHGGNNFKGRDRCYD